MGGNPLNLLSGAGRTIDIGAPEPGAKQMPAAEDVQRQVATAIIVAMKEPAFLAPVDRIAGGIEIKNDLLGRLGAGLQDQVCEQARDGGPVMAGSCDAGPGAIPAMRWPAMAGKPCTTRSGWR